LANVVAFASFLDVIDQLSVSSLGAAAHGTLEGADIENLFDSYVDVNDSFLAVADHTFPWLAALDCEILVACKTEQV